MMQISLLLLWAIIRDPEDSSLSEDDKINAKIIDR
jgi:hypothetical protein